MSFGSIPKHSKQPNTIGNYKDDGIDIRNNLSTPMISS